MESVVIHKSGSLSVTHISNTTNATVISTGAEVTVPTTLGFSVTCKTSNGTDIGKITGVAAGNAVMDINAVLTCGFLLPSAIWIGEYTVTSPTGLGVVE